MDRNTILGKLPAYRGRSELIHPDQSVGDIILEVLEAHEVFAADYDNIALCFDDDTTERVCKNLVEFCKKNFRYDEQDEDSQVTMSPAAMLTLGHVDCKNYAGFCGGILDALNRLTTRKINWCYRFASYKMFNEVPHHVFIVVNPKANEIWLDPTPGSEIKKPYWQLDKKVKVSAMALHRISGAETDNGVIGAASLTLQPRININPLNWNYSNHYPAAFNPYLGLSQYRDEGGERNLNNDQMAAEINALIAAGPSPGHTIRPDFVQWVYDTNLRSFNFYYPGGVRPGFAETAAAVLPANYPHLIITDDGRLTFNIDQKIDDFKNPEIHILTAWAQDLINQFDPTPYPIKPQHLKEFSQLQYGNVDTRNLFTERRGYSIFQEVAQGLENTINFLKDGALKIIGSIPRNSFLALVGINAFGMATSLQNKINGGEWDDMADTWKQVGGNPDKLRNTIEDGANKPAILGSQLYASGAAIGAAPAVAAWLAAAAPIIAMMIKFLDKDGNVSEVLSATKTFIASKYPDLDLSAFGFLDKKTGKPVPIVIDPADDENSGGGNDSLPGSFAPWEWVKRNPLPSVAIALLLWQLFAPAKYKLLK